MKFYLLHCRTGPFLNCLTPVLPLIFVCSVWRALVYSVCAVAAVEPLNVERGVAQGSGNSCMAFWLTGKTDWSCSYSKTILFNDIELLALSAGTSSTMFFMIIN